MEAKNHLFETENNFFESPFLGSMFIFQGVYKSETKFSDSREEKPPKRKDRPTFGQKHGNFG